VDAQSECAPVTDEIASRPPLPRGTVCRPGNSGFKSDFLYYGADSGGYMPGGFIAQPLHITDRGVEWMLTADNDLICLSAERLASRL
jgi:hypothetical protein